MEDQPGDITVLLQQLSAGNRTVEERLIPVVYGELRRLAARYMRSEHPGHTLQATALVHEAYVRLTEQQDVSWQNRAHFFAVAAQLMRRILVDHARANLAEKRGGRNQQKVELEEVLAFTEDRSTEILSLDEALERLAELDPRQSRIVELRYFAGLSVEETAEVMHISGRTVKRDWTIAKAWLYGELTKVRRVATP